MDKKFSSQEDSEIHLLLETLGSEHGMERQKAREALVAKGKSTIDFLMELLSHPKYIFRWEAAKTLEEIGDPLAIPLFIRTLEDEKSDVRWIAAKGLIKLGELSVKPLLQALIEKSDSVFILEGAHHVFFDLHEDNKLPDDFPIDKFLAAFKNPSFPENIKSLAYEILNSK
ncbi:MAG: HEAT repeat domain-containing protein [Ignavibacteriaceae bacterium]|nr:HEAT repeat domain-containing protein [Ignavibacteriaceae bacterium]